MSVISKDAFKTAIDALAPDVLEAIWWVVAALLSGASPADAVRAAEEAAAVIAFDRAQKKLRG